MMDHHGDDDAGETSAVKSKIEAHRIKRLLHTGTCGNHPYRDWCRVSVGGAGRSDAHKRQREEQNGLPVDYGFFTDGQEPTPKGDSEITKGATPFPVVKVNGVEDQAATKETVDSLNRLGYPELNCQIRQ